MDIEILARLQFALTIMFHYLFPPLTIGMGIVLVYLEGQYLRTGKTIYHQSARFWTRIFALNFAIGVASGIVMEFQFGTNWATYSRFVGDVFGSALAAEGIFAFFLESGFLAVLVFGWDRVSKGMHFFSTCMVALGSMFSSVWIVVANSWQQTPAGHHIVPIIKDGAPWVVDGVKMFRAEITDFWQLVFNPSFGHRIIHVLIGCFIMGAFFIMSISAWYIIKKKHLEFAKHSFRGALILAFVSSIAILISGHSQAKNVYKYQPAKMAAFEGHFKTEAGDLTLFGWPNSDEDKVDFKIAIPGGLSFLLFENFTDPVIGLDKFKKEDRPPLGLSFLSWRIMVGIGTFFILLTSLGLLLLRKDAIFKKPLLMWVFVLSVIPAVFANQFGWIAAEVGRQPWIVQAPVNYDSAGELITNAEGQVDFDELQGLRTSNALSKVVSEGQVIGSIIGFLLIYGLLFAVWIFVLNDKIQKGPEIKVEGDGEGGFFATAAGEERMMD